MRGRALDPVALPAAVDRPWRWGAVARRASMAGLWATAAAAQWAAVRPALAGEHKSAEVILYHFVGASFAVCGLLAWYRRPDARTGPLMVVTGLLFFARSLLSRVDSPVAQTVAMAIGNLWVITFVALLVSFPSRPHGWTLGMHVTLAVFAFAEIGLVVAWMLFTPFPGNLIVLSPEPGVADALNKASGVIGFAAALSVAVLLARRWKAATPGVRRASAPVAAGGATLAFLAGVLLEGAFTTWQSPLLVWPTLVGLLLVPVVFLGGVWRSWVARAAVGDLLVELAARPETSLQTAMRKALRDPTLVLAYWLPEYGGYVDGDGNQVERPAASEERATAMVEQDGRRVAAIAYDASLAQDRRLLDAVVAAAGLALRNGRLSAELRARVSELGASRARIVQAGDAERRRLERNLHDGAQQRLVALSMRLTRLKARIDDDPAQAKELASQANAEVAASLKELRELARGLHPSVLDHGLAIALESVGAHAVVSTSVSVEVGEPLPEAVEIAAYFVASEALANVDKHAHATRATVQVRRSEEGALIEIGDDGIGGADDAGGSGLRGLADRVEALDGRLGVVSRPGAGTTVTAVIPCGC